MIRTASRRLMAAAVCLCAVGASLVYASQADAQTSALTVQIVDPQPDATIASDLDVTVAVDLGGAESGTLLVELGPVSSTIDIPVGTCDAGCTKTTHLSVPNGDWDNPVESGPIYLHATVSAPDAEPVSQVYGLTLDGPSRITDFSVVRNGIEYHTEPVLDGAATVRLGAADRAHSDDVAEMRLVGGPSWTTLASGEAPWTADGDSYKAEIPFDVTSLEDGGYQLEVRSRTAAGRWNHGYQMGVRVSHVDVVSMTASPPYLVVGNATPAVDVTVRGAIPGNFTPGALRVTLDGVDHDLTSPAWGPYQWSLPNREQTLRFFVPGGELAAGTHDVTFQLLSTRGEPLGESLSRTYTVSAYSGSISVPKVQVVGQRLSGVAKGVAPIGHPFTSCTAGQTVSGPWSQGFGSWCQSPTGSFNAGFTFTAQAAGTGAAELMVSIPGVADETFSQPITVYAARRVSVTAPAVPYGSRGTARVTVQDAKLLNRWQGAPAGVRVTLQRLTAGTSTWLTVGSAYTVAGGTASIPFTSFANGRFRALVSSTVPGQTLISPTIAAVSLAVVSWRQAPTSAVRGKTYVYEAATKPYDSGAKAYLQVRPPGVAGWAGARTITLPSTGIARFSYAFSRIGYWRVRVFRGSTALRTGAPSSEVGVWVR